MSVWQKRSLWSRALKTWRLQYIEAEKCSGGFGSKMVTLEGRFQYLEMSGNDEIMSFPGLVRSIQPNFCRNQLQNYLKSFWHIPNLVKQFEIIQKRDIDQKTVLFHDFAAYWILLACRRSQGLWNERPQDADAHSTTILMMSLQPPHFLLQQLCKNCFLGCNVLRFTGPFLTII